MGEEDLALLDLHVGHLEGDDLVRLRRKKQELVLTVACLLALLEGAHKPVPRPRALLDLRVLYLCEASTQQLMTVMR